MYGGFNPSEVSRACRVALIAFKFNYIEVKFIKAITIINNNVETYHNRILSIASIEKILIFETFITLIS